jgi:colanic acid/amylovoran biosynthesis glycosyltransferase
MPPPVRILHLFDRYLNTTMNWAYRLIRNTPGTDIYIGAATMIKNQFWQEDFHFLLPPYQYYFPADEWHISRRLRYLRLADQYFFKRYQRRLIREIKDSGIQLIHAHFAPVGCQALAISRATGIPLAVSFYGLDYESLPYRQPRYRELYRQLFREAAILICEGPHGASLLEQMGCPADKIKIIPLGVDPGKIPVLEKTKSPGKLRLLQAATFTEKKGHVYTLQAFAAALPACPGMQLTLVGEVADKSLFQDVQRLIGELGLQDHISMVDFIPFDRFYDFLNDFDVFIHPSCYASNRDCEGGAPVVLLDVQATGMPVISTTHCDIPFEVIHEQTGLLCAEKDVAAISDGISFFYQMDNVGYQQYRRNAREHICRHFDIGQSGKKLADLYRESCSR